MKNQLQFSKKVFEKFSKLAFVFFFLTSFINYAQLGSLTVSKTIVENGTICNAFDVMVNVDGVAATKPQEVVLIIDRSGSMSDGTIYEPIGFAQDAAIDFVNNLFLPENNPTGLNKVAIVTYSDFATIDINLTDASNKQDVIDIINSIVTGGTTNIEDAMVKAREELDAFGTFNCAISRDIVLLTDGVANRDNLGNSCSEINFGTTCQQRAIAAGQNAWVINKNGVDYNQSVFTVGLTSLINGITEQIALDTLEQIQNSGAYSTDFAPDLTFIYNQIFGQLNFAAKQIPGTPFLRTMIIPGFEVVPGTIQTNKGTVTLNPAGNVLKWFVPQVVTESIFLKYTLVAVSPDVCGNQDPEDTEVNYLNPICEQVTLDVPSPSICVPCPTLTADISRQDCSNFIDYTGTFTNGPCINFTALFEWKFYLNGVLVGTSDTLSGTFEYTGTEPFEGEFTAILTFVGSGENGCTIPGITAEETINLSQPDAPVSTGDITECAEDPIQTLDANDAIVPVPGQTITWYDAPVGGNVVPNPILNTIGTITYYAEAVVEGGCGTSSRTAVTLTILDSLAAPISGGDQTECATSPIQTLTATATVPAGQMVVWYDAPVGGNVVANPILDTIGTVTYYAEAVTSDSSCSSSTRTAVTLTINNCAITIIKTAVPNNTDGCTPLVVGGIVVYNFAITNNGNVAIENVVLNDPLIDPVNPIPGPASGDINGNNILDEGETWIYTANYTVTQQDIINGQIQNTATVVGNIINTTTTVTASDSVTITICPSASLSVIKSQTNPAGGLGDFITYDIVVTNTGSLPVSNIEMTDANADILTGNPIALLLPGESATVTAQHEITAQDLAQGYVENSAIATGDSPTGIDDVTDISDTGTDTAGNPIPNPESVETPDGQGNTNGDPTDDPTVTVFNEGENASIALIKVGTFIDGDGDGCADVGESISYVFTVINTGNVTLTNITVTDPLVTVSGGPIDLAAGDSDATSFTATYTITQVDIDAGNVTNQATATGTTPSGGTVSDLSDDNVATEDDPTITVLCQNASIALIKVGTFIDGDGDGCADVGESISYVFTVINTGNVTLTNINVTDPLVTVSGGPIDLAAGDSDATSFTATYIITQTDIDAGNVTNQATATGTTPSGGTVSDLSDDNVATEDDPTITVLCQQSSIALIKTGVVSDTDGDGCADVKETITYSFTVVNTGNTTLTNINITDPLVNVQGGPITLAPGETDTATFTALYLITQLDINNGEVINQATVTGTTPSGSTVSDLSDDDNILEDDPTVIILCQNAKIALIKVGTPNDENDNGCVDLGETIVYDFTVTNLGNVTLTNVIITDPLITVNGGPIVLLAGISDTENFSGIYTVTQADVDNGFVSNQATAFGTAPNGAIVSDLSDNNSNLEDDPTVTILCQNPSIAVTKTGVFNDENGNNNSEVGETISYTFTVTNTGDVTLFNITISDPLPGITILGGPIAQLLPGETDSTTFTAEYAITQTDIDNLEVVNQATVTGTTGDGAAITDLSDDPNDPTNADPNGDGNPDDPTVVILPNVLGIGFDIFNGVTPNGDGAHDYFVIKDIQEYGPNNVKIYNRWGVLVWDTDNYGGTNGSENVFTGESNGRATIRQSEELASGTYFYILTFLTDDNPGKSNYNGYLYLNR